MAYRACNIFRIHRVFYTKPWATVENTFALDSIFKSFNQMATLSTHINRLNDFCLVQEFQHISVTIDNLDLMEQGLKI